jgi:hypothetical protein
MTEKKGSIQIDLDGDGEPDIVLPLWFKCSSALAAIASAAVAFLI